MKYSMVAALIGMVACISFRSEAVAGPVMFDYAFNDGTISVTGILTADSNGDGTYTAIAGTANVTGAPYSGTPTFVANPNAPNDAIYASDGTSNADYDDILIPGSSPSLTNGGLLFEFQNGVFLNIFADLPFDGYVAAESTSQFTQLGGSQSPGTFTLSAVPEPSSLIMLGTAGAAAFARFIWGRRGIMARAK